MIVGQGGRGTFDQHLFLHLLHHVATFGTFFLLLFCLLHQGLFLVLLFQLHIFNQLFVLLEFLQNSSLFTLHL